MSHHSSGQDEARLKCPSHTGATQKIRGSLEREPGQSVYKLQLSTGLKATVIRSCLAQMVARTGGVVAVAGPRYFTYFLTRQAPKQQREPKQPGPYAIAGAITIPSYRWGSMRLG